MRRAVATLAVLLSLVGLPASAADPSSTLIALLGWVPDSVSVRSNLVSYVDYRAVEETRIGAAQPASTSEWLGLRDAEDPAFELWLAALRGVRGGSGKLVQGVLWHGAAWPDLLGFDFFDVDQELAFGAPPSDGMVLAGSFDPDAIARAFRARDFVSTEVDGHSLWCGPLGCADGMRFDPGNIDRANPFGGSLGRQEPMAVSVTDLLGSADIATVDAMLAAATDRVPSLADDPIYRAALESLDPADRLIQATLVPPHLLLADPAVFFLDGSVDDAADRWARLAAMFEPIPFYLLVLIADGATASDQVVTVALVYERAADAQVAADVIPRRIQTLDSSAIGRPVRDVFEARGVTSVSGTVQPSADGARSTAVIELRAPLAADRPDSSSGRLVDSSMVYQLLVDMLYRRDALWIAPELPELE